ncbi:MAG TPA: FAD-dependent monooxygenase [Stellaceae bacterium]|jgi:2-polyprenyl-6-methoxyphenol hydroxylase-like FAD-dependent oxidoreductase
MSDTGSEIAVPVIIVGGGPVGMTLAMSLHALGVGCVIVNTEVSPRWHPKGSTQNARTMEIYRRLGISETLRSMGLAQDYPLDIGYFTRLTGWELTRIEQPSEREKQARVAAAGPTDQVPEPLLRLNQMICEDFLFKHIQTLAGIDVRFGWQCTSFTPRTDGIGAEIEHVESGRKQRIEAEYIVGCDGGRGLVRRQLGVKYGGDSANPDRPAYLNGPMVSTYVSAPDFFKRIPHKRCWQYWTVNRDVRSNTMIIDQSTDILFGTSLRHPDEKPDPAAIARQFIASYGENIEFKLIDHKPWTAGHALVADRFGEARMILCGDSAHLFTPTGGFGLNTGNDDAFNLAWKLAALTQGWGGPALLASYEIERRPIALRNTTAGKLLANNVGAVPIGEAINENSPNGEVARKQAADFLSTFDQEFASLGVQLGGRYDQSSIIAAEDEPPPPDDPAVYTPSSVPGGRAPHLRLDGHRSLYDEFGRGFTLLRFRNAADTRPLEHAARTLRMPMKVVDVALDAGRDLYERDLALIRPDMYVAWRGNHLPEDCAALVARVTGR